jgi:hypothetical protein
MQKKIKVFVAVSICVALYLFTWYMVEVEGFDARNKKRFEKCPLCEETKK